MLFFTDLVRILHLSTDAITSEMYKNKIKILKYYLKSDL